MTMRVSSAAGPALRGLLDEGRRRAARLGQPVLVSVARPVADLGDMPARFEIAGLMGELRALWAKPSEGLWLVAAGEAVTLRGHGRRRFLQAREAHQALMRSALTEAPDLPGVGPLCLGGFRFDPEGPQGRRWRSYGDGLLLLPRYLLARLPEGCWATSNVLVGARSDVGSLEASLEAGLEELLDAPPGEVPPPGLLRRSGTSRRRWQRIVRESLALVRSGPLSKVVLARELRLSFGGTVSPAAVLRRLAASYPDCLVFAMGCGEAAFLGATPELLISLREGQVRGSCLAGSAPRGATPEEDELMGRALLERAKDRREHAFVVEAVQEALVGLCTGLRWDSSPALRKLPTVQHLRTSFVGASPTKRHVLELVERLHPTPAVGGVPVHRACQVIRDLERGDRGWYAGPVGWVGPSGDGEFGVAIRSALVCGDRALLYAGAGIVAGSDPEQEFAEAELKFAPMRSALMEGDDGLREP